MAAAAAVSWLRVTRAVAATTAGAGAGARRERAVGLGFDGAGAGGDTDCTAALGVASGTVVGDGYGEAAGAAEAAGLAVVVGTDKEVGSESTSSSPISSMLILRCSRRTPALTLRATDEAALDVDAADVEAAAEGSRGVARNRARRVVAVEAEAEALAPAPALSGVSATEVERVMRREPALADLVGDAELVESRA